jgi:hypothetical protein
MNYENLLLTADSLLAEFGQPVTITSKSTGQYNADTGAYSETEVTVSTVAVVDTFTDNEKSSGSIKFSDRKLLVSPVGVSAILPNDTITVGTDKFSVIDVKIIKPAAIVILYEVQVRGVT